MKNRKSDLKEVLALVTVGRKALGMAPLKQVPKGIIGEVYEVYYSPLSRALDCPVIELEEPICPHCGCAEVMVEIDSKRARALSKAWEATRDGGRVYMPVPLTRFSREYQSGLWPELAESDWIKLDESVAEELDCDSEVIKQLATSLKIEILKAHDGMAFVRRSELIAVMRRVTDRASTRKAAA